MTPNRRALLVASVLLLAACSTGASPFAATTSTSRPEPTTTGAPTTSTTVETTTTSVAGDGSGVGDPYFPELGNPGFDIEHYLIDLAVDPVANTIEGEVAITATATGDLDAFHLDLLGLTVDRITVDDHPTAFSREGGELIVSAEPPIPSGEGFAVVVTYHGTPEPLTTIGFPLGWIDAGDITYVVSEPDAAHTWFPGNDHPGDKAAFTFRITVPEGLTAAANGSLVQTLPGGAVTTFVWEMPEPMATYLATVVIGDLDRVERPAPGGVLLRDYLPADLEGQLPSPLARVGEMLEFYAGIFGPSPFAEYGHAVVPGVPGALEDQTLCIFGREELEDYQAGPFDPSIEEIVAHELSHQWYGDSVTPATWNDIWLNEGFATFAQWLWVEHDLGRAAYDEEIANTYRLLDSASHPLPGDPGPSGEEMFHYSVYLRGGLTLHALRVAVGDDALFQILRTWADRYAYGNASTADFIALAEEVSGADLDALFDTWLYQEEMPPMP